MPDWLPYLETPVPAQASDVERAGALARLPVPADLRALLTDRQGQVPRQGAIALGTGGSTAFGPILVVSPRADSVDETYSVAYALAALAEWSQATERDPAFFPFASDTASGWFCLDQRDPAQPVVFIDTTYGPEERGAISPVAPTVTDLLSRLRE